MTLFEIMIVVAIIGMILGGVGVMAFNQLKKARLEQAKRDVASIKGAVGLFGAQSEEPCPKSIEELKEGKYVNKLRDPWGQPYKLKCPSEHDDDADVWSSGPDRKEGTEDDIRSWVPTK
jgi:general secretion pathway protein G